MIHPRIKSSPWTHLLAAGAFLLLTAWSFPYFPKLGSPNELTRLYLTRAMVDDGTFSIDGPVQRYGPLTDMSKSGGKLYSDKAPGTSMLGVPVYMLVKLFHGWQTQEVRNSYLLRWLRISISGLGAALTMLVLLTLLKNMGLGLGRRLFFGWAWALGTVAFPYGSLLYGHGLCTLWLMTAFWTLMKMAKSSVQPWVPILAGASMGLALLTEYTSVLLLAPMALAAAYMAKKRPRDLLLGTLGASIPLILLALYHQACFGAPWITGYAHLANRHYAHIHEQGFMGLVTPSFHRLWVIMFGSSRGLLFYSPWLALAPIGLARTILHPLPSQEKARPIWIAISVAIMLYLLFAMSLKIDAWGWSLGPRHLTPLVPFLALAAAMIFMTESKFNRAFSVFSGIAVPYSILATTIPFIVFGGFPPDFTNPLADFIAPLLLHGCVAPNIGSQMGMPTWIGLLPMWIAQAALLVWMFRTLPLKAWLKYLTIALSLLAVLFVFSFRGENPPRENKALTWVAHDILKCSHKAQDTWN